MIRKLLESKCSLRLNYSNDSVDIQVSHRHPETHRIFTCNLALSIEALAASSIDEEFLIEDNILFGIEDVLTQAKNS